MSFKHNIRPRVSSSLEVNFETNKTASPNKEVNISSY